MTRLISTSKIYLPLMIVGFVSSCAPTAFTPPTAPSTRLVGEEQPTLKGDHYLPPDDTRESITMAFQVASEGRFQLQRFEDLNIRAAMDFLRYTGPQVSASALVELCHSVSRTLQTGSKCDQDQSGIFLKASSILLTSIEPQSKSVQGVYVFKSEARGILESLGVAESKALKGIMEEFRLSQLDLAYLLTFLAKTAQSLDFNSGYSDR